MTLSIFEVFQAVSDASTKKEKLDLLRRHMNPVMKKLLDYAFLPEYEFDLSLLKDLNWKKSLMGPGLAENTLYNEHKRMYLFLKGNPTPTPRKRTILLQIFESLYYKETEIVIAIMNKKLNSVVKGLTPALYQELFPN